MTVPPHPIHDALIPEDVIERAARAWESDFESYTLMLRAEALEDASRALTASGLPARVAELEAALADLVERQYDYPTHLSYDHEWFAAFDRARAALNAKGVPDACR